MSSSPTTELTVGSIREGTAVLSSDSLEVVRLPLCLLPPGVSEGSVIELSSAIKPAAADARDQEIRALQQSMLSRLQSPPQTLARMPEQRPEGSRSTDRTPHGSPPCELPAPPSPVDSPPLRAVDNASAACPADDACHVDAASVSESGDSSAPYVPFNASRSLASGRGKSLEP